MPEPALRVIHPALVMFLRRSPRTKHVQEYHDTMMQDILNQITVCRVRTCRVKKMIIHKILTPLSFQSKCFQKCVARPGDR